MDEKYAQLLETLATKLGTTAEHLWGVLVRQAPISGMTNLVLCIIFALGLWKLIIFVKHKTNHRNADWYYDRHPAWFGVSVVTAMISIGLLISIPTIVTAFANPEYWALKQLLSMVRGGSFLY